MRAAKNLVILFLVTLFAYVTAFTWIEHLRRRDGPWQVTFLSETNSPALIICQPRLGLQAVRINFPDESWPTNRVETVRFDQARPVPFAAPFGQCVFLDTTTLPGNVTLQLFGHEIQLLPRTLTIDHREQAWPSNATLVLKGRM